MQDENESVLQWSTILGVPHSAKLPILQAEIGECYLRMESLIGYSIPQPRSLESAQIPIELEQRMEVEDH